MIDLKEISDRELMKLLVEMEQTLSKLNAQMQSVRAEIMERIKEPGK